MYVESWIWIRLGGWFSLLILIVLLIRIVFVADFISNVGILSAVIYWMLFSIISKVQPCLGVFRVHY